MACYYYRSTRVQNKKLYFFKLIVLLHFLALKGRNITAQGNALGKIYSNDLSPERATHKLTMIKGSHLCSALTGLKNLFYISPGWYVTPFQG